MHYCTVTSKLFVHNLIFPCWLTRLVMLVSSCCKIGLIFGGNIDEVNIYYDSKYTSRAS